MEDVLTSPITWAVVALLSEIIGASKLKQNTVIALLMDTIRSLKPKDMK